MPRELNGPALVRSEGSPGGAVQRRRPQAGTSGSALAQRWLRYRELPKRERRFALAVFLAFPLVELGLRLLGTRRLLGLLERLLPRPVQSLPGSGSELAEAVAASRLIDAVARGHLVPFTCLRRAVLLWWVLRRRGIQCAIRFGVRRRDGSEVHAHAWIESGEVVLEHSEDVESEFVVLSQQGRARSS